MRAFRKVLQGLIAVILAAWAGVRIMLDTIGRGQAAHDAASAGDLIDAALRWLFSTPWYVPALIASCGMLLLFFPEFLELSVLMKAGKFSYPAPNDAPFAARYLYFVQDKRAYVLFIGIALGGAVFGWLTLAAAVWIKSHSG
jgi:hypothetical protein